MAASVPPAAPISLFYSYSHEDEELRKKLETHLSPLRDQGVIQGWHDRCIQPGMEWDGVISEKLAAARIILLLVSADFLASRYCSGVEMAQAMKRHEAGMARVIPVILRPADWQSAPFGKLQALPKNGRPVNMWKNRDAAFADVARGIREMVSSLAVAAPTAPPLGRPSSTGPIPAAKPRNLARKPPVGKLTAVQAVYLSFFVVGAVLAGIFVVNSRNDILSLICILSVIAMGMFGMWASDRRRQF